MSIEHPIAKHTEIGSTVPCAMCSKMRILGSQNQKSCKVEEELLLIHIQQSRNLNLSGGNTPDLLLQGGGSNRRRGKEVGREDR